MTKPNQSFVSGCALMSLVLFSPALGDRASAGQQVVRKPPAGTAAVRRTAKNTLQFDHRNLSPVFDDGPDGGLQVLEVGDGDYFQLEFNSTYPACFSYTVTASDEARPEATGQVPGEARMVAESDLRTAAVVMKHHAAFGRYRVDVKARCAAHVPESLEQTLERAGSSIGLSLDAVQDFLKRSGGKPTWTQLRTHSLPNPVATDGALIKQAEELKKDPQLVELREISFDLWVRTAPTWRLMVNGGATFQNFKSPEYAVVTEKDEAGKEVKLFTQGEVAENTWPAVLTLVSAFPPSNHPLRMFGASIGFGGQGRDLRYYLGGSVSLGDHLIFTAGRAWGLIDQPPVGQALDAAPISDNVLANLRSKPKSAWSFGFAWGFDVKSKPATVEAFGASASGRPAAETPPAMSNYTGTYATDNELAVVSSDGAGVRVRLNSQTLDFPIRKDTTFADVSGRQSVTFEVETGKKAASALTLKLESGEIKAPRARSLDTFSGTYEFAGTAASPGKKVYSVSVSGTGLLVTLPDASSTSSFSRRGDTKFLQADDATKVLTFTIADGKVTALTIGGVTASRVAGGL